jgi:hypothetical protein
VLVSDSCDRDFGKNGQPEILLYPCKSVESVFISGEVLILTDWRLLIAPAEGRIDTLREPDVKSIFKPRQERSIH